jgi:hypothetical protein
MPDESELDSVVSHMPGVRSVRGALDVAATHRVTGPLPWCRVVIGASPGNADVVTTVICPVAPSTRWTRLPASLVMDDSESMRYSPGGGKPLAAGG